MSRLSKWVALVGLVLIASAPVFAGHGKCKASTQECLNKMAAHMKNSGWVGVELEEDEATGAYAVSKVIPGSPAEEAGIRAGDVLYAMNGIEISEENEQALKKMKQDLKPGRSVDYTIKRDGYDRQVTVTLAPMPADMLAKYVGQHMLEHVSSGMATGK